MERLADKISTQGTICHARIEDQNKQIVLIQNIGQRIEARIFFYYMQIAALNSMYLIVRIA